MPIWRTVATALAAFALGAQLVLTGVFIGQVAAAADQSDGFVICQHEAAATNEGGSAPAPKPHTQCPDCMCVQSAKVLAPPLAMPELAFLRARSETVQIPAGRVPGRVHEHPPYASRAPPLSA
jgi:hypothetical protein